MNGIFILDNHHNFLVYVFNSINITLQKTTVKSFMIMRTSFKAHIMCVE